VHVQNIRTQKILLGKCLESYGTRIVKKLREF